MNNSNSNSNLGYIFFFSPRCVHCDRFQREMQKHNPQLFSKFRLVNVENKAVKLPPYLKEVPAIIIPNFKTGKNIFYSGNTVFNWLESLVEQRVSQYQTRYQQHPNRPPTQSPAQSPAQQQHQPPQIGNGLLDFDPLTMTNFSQGFASLNSDELGTGFASCNQDYSLGISVPQNMPVDNGENKTDDTKRRLDELMAQRDKEISAPLQRQ